VAAAPPSVIEKLWPSSAVTMSDIHRRVTAAPRDGEMFRASRQSGIHLRKTYGD
jgi:hypothetical protein